MAGGTGAHQLRDTPLEGEKVGEDSSRGTAGMVIRKHLEGGLSNCGS